MTLAEAIATYVGRKRSEGHEFRKPERQLLSLRSHVGNLPLERVKARQVLAFLDGPKTSPVTWESKYNLLRSFFEFWVARGDLRALPLPAKRKTSPQAFIPYIYTQAEIRSLLRATRNSQERPWCSVDALTIRTFLLVLYGTGALVGEALRLAADDVNLGNGTVTIRNGRFNRIRRIPVGPDLKAVLGEYSASRSQWAANSSRLFLNKRGEGLNESSLSSTFQRLRRVSGVVRNDGARYQPRMHDLRHTFAVHRITSWIKHGADMNRMLPALAAYMGLAGIASTERYMSLTPERFRTQLAKLSPEKGKKRWRDDRAIMRFLAEL